MSDSSSVILFYGATIIIYVIMFLVLTVHRRKHQDKLEADAAKYGGHVVSGGIFAYPELRFPVDDLEARVKSWPGSKNSPPKTIFECDLPHIREYTVNIFNESVMPRIGKLFGLQDIQLNDPLFDNAFLVQGTDEMVVLSLLTPEIRAQLRKLKEEESQISVQLRKQKLRVSVYKNVVEKGRLDGLIETGCALVRQIRQAG